MVYYHYKLSPHRWFYGAPHVRIVVLQETVANTGLIGFVENLGISSLSTMNNGLILTHTKPWVWLLTAILSIFVAGILSFSPVNLSIPSPVGHSADFESSDQLRSSSMGRMVVDQTLRKGLSQQGTEQEAVEMLALARDLKQFSSSNHTLGFHSTGSYIASMVHALSVDFAGANAVVPVFPNAMEASKKEALTEFPKASHQNLWSNIDLE